MAQLWRCLLECVFVCVCVCVGCIKALPCLSSVNQVVFSVLSKTFFSCLRSVSCRSAIQRESFEFFVRKFFGGGELVYAWCQHGSVHSVSPHSLSSTKSSNDEFRGYGECVFAQPCSDQLDEVTFPSGTFLSFCETPE